MITPSPRRRKRSPPLWGIGLQVKPLQVKMLKKMKLISSEGGRHDPLILEAGGPV